MLAGLTRFHKLTGQNVRRNTLLQIIIATLAFVLCVRIWPMGLVQEYSLSQQQALQEAKYAKEDVFQAPDKKLQGVRFTQDYLYQMTLYMSCLSYEKDDYVIFRIYDDRFSCIYEETVGCSQIMRDACLIATPDMEVIPGQDYYYEILIPEYDETYRNITEKLILPVADKAKIALEENQILYIDGIYNDKEALVADFDYTSSLAWWKTVLYLAGIAVCAVLIYFAATKLCDSCYEVLVTRLKMIKWGLTGVSAILGIVAFYYCVITNTFGNALADKVMYCAAILAMLAICMCTIWMPRIKRVAAGKSVPEQASSMWRNYLQAVSFGLLFYSLCLYVNAEREYTHITNVRWMLIFLGLAFLMIHTFAELKNMFSYIWLAVSGVVSIVYCTFVVKADAEVLYVTRLTAAVVVIWGLVLINALLQIRKDCWKNLSKPFFTVWLLFVALMFYWKAERSWVYIATLPFVVLLLYNLSAAARNRLLRNMTRGLFISLGIYMLYSMHHRPYNAWIFFRYGGIFYTVACAGMYLAVVSGAALGRVCAQWKTSAGLLRRGWRTLFVWAISISSVLLTMSRAAMLTVAVNSVLVFAFAVFIYKKRFKHVLKELGLLLAAVVICFPLTYSAARIVPAVANDPVYSNFEKGYITREHNVFKGDATNDMEKYMSIERYIAILFGRFQVSSEQVIDNSTVKTDETSSTTEGVSASVDAGKDTYIYVIETNEDVSNGRFDIYSSYFNALSMEGHELMELELSDGQKLAHAHSSYLQVAYDFGIPAAIIFLVLCAITFWKSIATCYRYGRKYDMYLVAFSLVIVFGVISVTEWAFHPCIPVGFVFLLIQMLLMQKPADKEL